LEAVPDARTVPQIFLDGNLIGGFTELKKHLQG
jgi:glutaredoxin